MNIKFLTSAAGVEGFPDSEKPEIAIVGRSNCGKSSLINALWKAKVAKTSSSPGRTALVNFFDVGKRYRVVDTPGYGFAKGDAATVGAEAIKQYLSYRYNLAGALLLMDVRRDWSEDEVYVTDHFTQRNVPWVLGLTKFDKLGRSEQQKRLKALQASSKASKVFPLSSLKNTGVEELELYMFNQWIEGANQRPNKIP